MIKGPEFPYGVGFSTKGESCGSGSDSSVRGLVLDRGTGELLYCGVVPGLSGTPAGKGGGFTGDETARVISLAKSRAAEGGLSEDDESAVTQLATDIGRSHGYAPPPLAERLTGSAGPYGIGVGLVLLVGLAVWGHSTGYMDRP
ncbi:hypothetical protein [Streptomyces albidus (ex Kaewkla and Franco 2022)]|uniref:hypothetical protein n=1 Tax=Streptomyces albidus (ex Kaewkla and Franco 2022) TaxID=722709 RepID=UPI0015EFD4DE|nr:hypothetical protein [Streptomyces albidus (ex Kaewkla and Franco 2022)]